MTNFYAKKVDRCPPYRYGTELEGRYVGQPTLIVPNTHQHRLETVLAVLEAHQRTATHLWLECQPGEFFDWAEVERLAQRFNITLQVREPYDMPPHALRARVSMVWMVSKTLWPMLDACDFVKVVHGPGRFDGYEIPTANKIRFRSSRYTAEDEVWPG